MIRAKSKSKRTQIVLARIEKINHRASLLLIY